MSRHRFSPAQRLAILRTHGGRCYLCTEPLPFVQAEVDHVVPESLEDRPGELDALRRQLGLSDDFSVNSYANWLPAHGHCNRGKSDILLGPAPVFVLRLRRAAERAADAAALAEKIRRQPSVDRALAVLIETAEAAGLDADDWASILGFLAREGPELAEPLRLTAGLSVVPAAADPGASGRTVAEGGGLRIVEGLYGEVRALREEQTAANREVLRRLDRLADAAHVLAGRPSLSDLIPGPSDERAGVPPSRAPALDTARIAEAFGAASALLLAWPQETAGRWLERPELDTLRAALADPERRVTVLLGGPGSGKSALLARLGAGLRAAGTALLALKADRIDRSVSSLRGLEERHLQSAPGPVLDCLARLAGEGPVVLLIDQLDALAELMDQHTGRLAAVLALVEGARRIDGVRVVLSCREFDFRHDVQLATLDAASVRLGTPAWEQVEPLLRARGLRPEPWQAEFREVLRTPQHLNLLLTHLADRDEQPAYDGYLDMMEEVLRRRVLEPHGPAAVEAAYRVAAAMAEDEELWVPAARFDGLAREIDALWRRRS